MGAWHSDHCGQRKGHQTHANDFLNRYAIPSGGWFYLNGSHPDRSGIAVIEYSHTIDWQPPEGFHMDAERRFLHRDGDDTPYSKLDIPGMIPVITDPGDLILFSALTLHVNMETKERRYSCGKAFRPKSIQVEVPWALPSAARQMIERLPDHLKPYTEDLYRDRSGLETVSNAEPHFMTTSSGKKANLVRYHCDTESLFF